MMRRLTLRTERLTELTPDELSALAGGAGMEDSVVCFDLPTNWEMCVLLKQAIRDALYTETCRC